MTAVGFEAHAMAKENPFEALKTQKQIRGLDYMQALKSGCLLQGRDWQRVWSYLGRSLP